MKGGLAGQPVRLTVNAWLKARLLAESYWLYVVWNPTGGALRRRAGIGYNPMCDFL